MREGYISLAAEVVFTVIFLPYPGMQGTWVVYAMQRLTQYQV